MEDRKANIISVISVIALIILVISARVLLKLSRAFFLICGASIAAILAVFSCVFIRHRYNRRRKLLESQLRTEGRELRIEHIFLRKVAGVPTKYRFKELEEATDGSEGQDQEKVGLFLPKIVNVKVREGKFMEIVERGGVEESEVTRLVYIALWCIQEKPRLRPSMAQVVDMPEGRVRVNEPPGSRMILVDLLAVDEDPADHKNLQGC
ncbi:hypothetical protein JHK82_011457 [Glycine max]|nr:hypothetical protein JHK85_011775 [Glycine max]KAG5056452.1 hypothetical protein JHK86_011448 [Glycine max]KAG5153488.1 hypothetical protein JHK82_011457 [Glycine max]